MDKNIYLLNILKPSIDTNLHKTFPNFKISLRILCSFLCSNASKECPIYLFKIMKIYLRSSMINEKLRRLSILCIGNNYILEEID